MQHFDEGAKICRLQYAAFFSDNHHEILEVKSGARISIAFNLISKKRETCKSVVFPSLTSPVASTIKVS